MKKEIKKKIIFCWHIHHGVLIEPLTEPLRTKIKYIKENKSKDEIELSLKLLKPVKGKLPQKLIEAGKAYIESWPAYDKARKAYSKAREAYGEAEKAHQKEINILHKKECPGCPWNGRIILCKEK